LAAASVVDTPAPAALEHEIDVAATKRRMISVSRLLRRTAAMIPPVFGLLSSAVPGLTEALRTEVSDWQNFQARVDGDCHMRAGLEVNLALRGHRTFARERWPHDEMLRRGKFLHSSGRNVTLGAVS
jgi:hypothetical protein